MTAERERAPATPFELSLATELDVEFQRFANKWLFPWHQLNMRDRSLDVDDFRGGRITLGNVEFDGQPQQIYWLAIGRYLSLKTHEILASWDAETRVYPRALRSSSLDRAEGLLTSFAGQVVGKALDTDRKLRGRGYPQKDTPHWAGKQDAAAKAEVMRLAQSHRDLLATQPPSIENGPTVPTASPEDFRAQAQHEARRSLARLNDTVRGIEAERAAEGRLKSGPTVKIYAKAMVAALEEYLVHLMREIATFAAVGVPRAELIAVARESIGGMRISARANSTITKLERMLGGTASGRLLDQQGAIFDAHVEANFSRLSLGLPSNFSVTSIPRFAGQYDVFVSHASEDKADFVDRFVAALEARGLKVWYDKSSLGWGGSVRQQIDIGLATSRFGVVVLSPSFVEKYWPQAELDGLLNLETTGSNRVLPIWHKISHADVVKFSPTVSGKLARETARVSVDELADELAKLCNHP